MASAAGMRHKRWNDNDIGKKHVSIRNTTLKDEDTQELYKFYGVFAEEYIPADTPICWYTSVEGDKCIAQTELPENAPYQVACNAHASIEGTPDFNTLIDLGLIYRDEYEDPSLHKSVSRPFLPEELKIGGLLNMDLRKKKNKVVIKQLMCDSFAKRRFVLVAHTDIQRGEELFWDYGSGYEKSLRAEIARQANPSANKTNVENVFDTCFGPSIPT